MEKRSSEVGQSSRRQKAPETITSATSTSKLSKAELKFKKANEKRQAKREAKEEERIQKKLNKEEKGKDIVCSSCGKKGHSRTSNKACENYKPRRRFTTEFKRTSIIKTSLENTCRSQSFVSVTRQFVLHLHDVTYAGSLFVDYYYTYLLSNGSEIPPISHQLVYDCFSLIAGRGSKAPIAVKQCFDQFKRDVPAFRQEDYRSEGYMTLISESAKQYEEAARNHVVVNFK